MSDVIEATPAPAYVRRQVRAFRLIAACSIGNGLEIYDFIVFSFFARTIGALFFPSGDSTAQLLAAFATYGVGFFLRPLGGVVLGAFADRRGRKIATLVTLAFMACGTAMVGLAPTYATAGVAGPLVIVLGRLIQGFSAGGEVGASTTLLVEYAPPAQRGWFGSWQFASQGLAVMVAAGIAFVIFATLPPAAVTAWGWRVPFLLGILIVPVGLWLRQTLEETHANIADARTEKISSLRLVLTRHLGALLSGVGLVIGATAANAVVVLYMATYAVAQLKMAPVVGLLAGIVAGFITLVGAPAGGLLSDRLGRKPVSFVSYALILVLIYPAFLYLNAGPGEARLLTIVGVLSLLNAVGGGALISVLAEIFPVEARATGMSLVYAIGVAIFGGFGQFIVTWLIAATGSGIAPAYYVMACAIATLAALGTVKETKGTDLS